MYPKNTRKRLGELDRIEREHGEVTPKLLERYYGEKEERRAELERFQSLRDNVRTAPEAFWVAAYAESHFVVRREGNTASVTEVQDDERVEELSRMLAGLPDSERGREHAAELLTIAGAS